MNNKKTPETELKYVRVVHPFGPLYDENSELLILGSLPSVASREQRFFYGHPQNRFWPLLAALFNEDLPVTIEEKRALALRNRVALWDTIQSCDIIGSSDSSIKNAVPTDLAPIIAASKITRIYCNGAASGSYFKKYQQNTLKIEAVTLPSTSPANAAWSLQRLTEAWRVILKT